MNDFSTLLIEKNWDVIKGYVNYHNDYHSFGGMNSRVVVTKSDHRIHFISNNRNQNAYVEENQEKVQKTLEEIFIGNHYNLKVVERKIWKTEMNDFVLSFKVDEIMTDEELINHLEENLDRLEDTIYELSFVTVEKLYKKIKCKTLDLGENLNQRIETLFLETNDESH